MRPIHQILADIAARQVKDHPKYYQPLEDPEEAVAVRAYYRTLVATTSFNKGSPLVNAQGTLISLGYNRIVVGDYGAYIECLPDQIHLSSLEQRWPGKPTRPVKYIWMQTKDIIRTKVYFQQGRFRYEDYIPGR